MYIILVVIVLTNYVCIHHLSILDSIDVHNGYTDPDNSTPPNTSPSDDCMSKPASVSSDNTLLGDCGVKRIKVDTREPEDDYGWTEYMRDTENSVDGISVCETHRVGDNVKTDKKKNVFLSRGNCLLD